MNRHNIDRLSKLIDFIQRDLTLIRSLNERQTACWEFGGLLESGFFLNTDEFFPPDALTDKEGIVATVDEVPLQLPWKMLIQCSEEILKLLEVLYITSDQNGYINYQREMTVDCRGNDQDATFVQYATSHSSTIGSLEIWYTLPESEKTLTLQSNSLAGKVLDLFEGLPIDRLKMCVDCGKFFIQKTAREKIYCSVLCKNRHILKRREVELGERVV